MKLSSTIMMLAVVLCAPVLADNHETRGGLADVWFVVPKAGQEGEFEAAIKAHMAMRAEKGESRRWYAFQPAVGHHMNVYQFRSGDMNWADQDAYLTYSEEQGFDEDWGANVHAHVDHYHHYLESIDWENSHWPEEGNYGPYFGVTSWTLKQNTGPGPHEARARLSQLAKEKGWADEHRWMWLQRIGGKPTLMVVVPYESYADMQLPQPDFPAWAAEHVGAETVAEWFNEFGSAFADADYSIWEYNPDLSSPAED